jgi:hypothetical protein
VLAFGCRSQTAARHSQRSRIVKDDVFKATESSVVTAKDSVNVDSH